MVPFQILETGVSHRMKKKEMNCTLFTKEENHQLIVQEIDHLLGVDAVSINASESLLNVAYDATKRQLDEIEEIVRKHECDIAHDWWTHFKEGYYKFVDQNVKDNASHEPWSCHKRPPGR